MKMTGIQSIRTMDFSFQDHFIFKHFNRIIKVRPESCALNVLKTTYSQFLTLTTIFTISPYFLQLLTILPFLTIFLTFAEGTIKLCLICLTQCSFFMFGQKTCIDENNYYISNLILVHYWRYCYSKCLYSALNQKFTMHFLKK